MSKNKLLAHRKTIVFGAATLIGALLVTFIGAQTGLSRSSVHNVEDIGEPAVVITRTNDGYEPDEVTIRQGQVVLWRNESDMSHWPASNIHPTHSIYSEFDPLEPIGPGEDWKFRFDKVGTWKFHDHVRANKTGVVHVLE